MTRKMYSIFSSAAFVVFESDRGYGVYTARAMQLAKIVQRISHSKGLKEGERGFNFVLPITLHDFTHFHSVMSMQSFRIGFFSPKQNKARAGRSGWGLPPRRTGRLGGGTPAGLVPPTCEAGTAGLLALPGPTTPKPPPPGEVIPREPLWCMDESGELGGNEPGVGSDPLACREGICWSMVIGFMGKSFPLLPGIPPGLGDGNCIMTTILSSNHHRL